jgi:hypothetical protein
MIIALLVTTGLLALSLWLTVMYVWWKEEQGLAQASATTVATAYFAICARLTRRGWYACTMYAKALGAWTNKKMQKLFFSLFPGAQPAFAKHDELAGLKHGPSSYFLRSISEKETTVSKKTVQKIFS